MVVAWKMIVLPEGDENGATKAAAAAVHDGEEGEEDGGTLHTTDRDCRCGSWMPRLCCNNHNDNNNGNTDVGVSSVLPRLFFLFSCF